MIRLFQVHFPSRTLLLVVTEATLIAGALWAATIARLGPQSIFEVDHNSVVRILIASLVCMLCMHYYDLYDSFGSHPTGEFLTCLLQVLGTSCLVLAVLYLAWPSLRLERGSFLLWILLVGVFVGLWRSLFCAVSRFARLKQRALMVGEGPLLNSLSQEIALRPELGLHVIGYAGNGEPDACAGSLARLGTLDEISDLVRREHVGRLVITLSDRRNTLPVHTLLHLKLHGVIIEDSAGLYEAITGRIALDALRPSHLLFSDGFRISTAVLFYKRVASIVFSALGLLISLPIMAISALCISLDSPGPVIFRQKRIGKDAKPFTLYKFRSMHVDPGDAEDPQAARENDARITRVGYWLRRLRIDEIPQLYNILRGDMYLIGPRPFTPNMEKLYAARIPYYSQRWAVKPGATGWAQVNRGYCASLEDNVEKLSYDLFYIRHLSIGLDCLVLFQTIKVLLLGRGSR